MTPLWQHVYFNIKEQKCHSKSHQFWRVLQFLGKTFDTLALVDFASKKKSILYCKVRKLCWLMKVFPCNFWRHAVPFNIRKSPLHFFHSFSNSLHLIILGHAHLVRASFTKGQLTSKCLFDVFNSSKKRTLKISFLP